MMRTNSHPTSDPRYGRALLHFIERTIQRQGGRRPAEDDNGSGGIVDWPGVQSLEVQKHCDAAHGRHHAGNENEARSDARRAIPVFLKVLSPQ